jgi:hypothetical protein
VGESERVPLVGGKLPPGKGRTGRGCEHVQLLRGGLAGVELARGDVDAAAVDRQPLRDHAADADAAAGDQRHLSARRGGVERLCQPAGCRRAERTERPSQPAEQEGEQAHTKRPALAGYNIPPGSDLALDPEQLGHAQPVVAVRVVPARSVQGLSSP